MADSRVPLLATDAFQSTVTHGFAFLSDLGFSAVRIERTLLRYESPLVCLEVSLRERSAALGLMVGLVGESQYELDEVLATFAPDYPLASGRNVRTAELLHRLVRSVSDVMQASCGPLLRGDPAAFAQLGRHAEPSRRARTLEATYGPTIARGDQAWESDDRSGAADLYEAALPALNPTRRRRLDYVRKRAS